MFKAWPKIPRWDNEAFYFSEKIDGTNACVVVEEALNSIARPSTTPLATLVKDGQWYHIWAQSRTRLITPSDDNYGFAKWVVANQNELYKLGHGYHFGEWWGQGIQRNYGMREKKFSLFNNTRWFKDNPQLPECCDVVPTIRAYSLEEAREYLIKNGSLAAPGFMNVEGVIMYLAEGKSYYKSIINK